MYVRLLSWEESDLTPVARLIVGDTSISGGLNALVMASYHIPVIVHDLDAGYTSPPKTFIINVFQTLMLIVHIYVYMELCICAYGRS